MANVADTVDDIALGTANGPMRLGEVFLRVISAALTISIALGPPDPAIIPVRSLDEKCKLRTERKSQLARSTTASTWE